MLELVKREGIRDEEVVSLASALLAHYQKHGSLIRAFAAAAKGDAGLERIAVSLRLSGCIGDTGLQKIENRNLAELLTVQDRIEVAGKLVTRSFHVVSSLVRGYQRLHRG